MRLNRGSIELVVLGLIAAMIVVLAIPLLTGFDRPASVPANKSQTEHDETHKPIQ